MPANDQIMLDMDLPVVGSKSVVSKAKTPAGFAASNYARLVNLFGYGLWSDDQGPLDLETAIKQSAILVCMDVISQDISKVTLRLRRRLDNGGSEVVKPSEHWLARMLTADPNEHHTWNEFIEMIVLHLCAVQNAFVAKKMTIGGNVEELVPLLPARVSILVDEESHQYVYDVQRTTPHERIMMRGLERFLLPNEVIHVRGRMFDGLFGYSNLVAGSAIMGLNKAVQDYQTRLYKHDGILRGIFQMKNEAALSEAAYQRLKDQLTELWARMRSTGAPIVLEEGMEFKAISMTADAAETAKAKQNAVEDAARLFRVPPHKMMHIVNVKYENMETLEKSYVQDTLRPVARRICAKMDKGLLTAKERETLYLEFDREEMELTDIKMQAEDTKVRLGLGSITIDESRTRRGQNPLPNGAGNVRLIPTGFHVVDENNQIVIHGGAQAPAAEDSEDQAETEDPAETETENEE